MADRLDVIAGTIVLDARLRVLFTVFDGHFFGSEARRVFVVLVATSTVRFTGRDRVERPETDRGGADFAGVGTVDPLDRELEGRDDTLGAAAAGDDGAGADGLFWTDRDERDGADCLAGRRGAALGAGATFAALDGADDRAG